MATPKAYKLNLLEWGLSSYMEAFEEEEIDDESFLLIDNDTINKIFKKSGPKLIFKKKFAEFLKIRSNASLQRPLKFMVETESTSSIDTNSTKYMYQPDEDLMQILELNTQKLGATTKEVEQTKEIDDILAMELHESPSSSGQKRPLHYPHTITKKGIQNVFPQSLEAVLKKYTDGQIVLCHKDKLNNVMRQKLCKIIINELIAVYGPELKAAIFIKVSEEIVALFGKEQSDTYFVPYRRCDRTKLNCSGRPDEKENGEKPKGQGARGKLWSRYLNVRAALKLAISQKKGLNETEKVSDSEAVNTPTTPQELSYLDFLKAETKPLNKVLEAWEGTFKIRKKLYINSELSKIFDDFPCLRLNSGLELIEKDFNTKFSDKTDVISHTCIKVSQAILQEARMRKTSVPNILECHDKLLRALLTLPFLFSPVTLRKSRKKGLWRPIKTEVAESFFLHITTFEELEEKIIGRREKLQEYGITLQPFGVIVGPANNPEDFYIIADDVKYKVETAIRAFELLFKFFHALDIEYPVECEHVWLFAAEMFFHIKPTKRNPATTALIADIKYHIDTEG